MSNQKPILAEICGKVVSTNRNNKYFSIYTEKMDKKFRGVVDFFFPIKEGDVIYGIAEYTDNKRYGETLTFLKDEQPFVVLSQDKNSILQCFLNALRGSGFGNQKAHSLYDLLEEKCGTTSTTMITNMLDRLSSQYCYHKTNIADITTVYTYVIKDTQITRLLNWWYKNRVLRRLYLFGIYNKEIRDSKMDPIEMYQKCLSNPYTVYSLSIEKCNEIYRRMGKEPSDEIQQCAVMTRYLKDHMSNKGWSGTPSYMFTKTFPDFKNMINTLKEEFDVKMELFTIYLPYVHEVETGITELVSSLVDGEALPHSLHSSEVTFTRDDLTKDQQEAVYRSLSENISIITGGGGTGKTTCIKEIVMNLDRNNIKYKVVSFTGKAVARIREVVGKKDPMTMHMMISTTKTMSFDHLIIDEASMVTSSLFYEFTQKFGTNYRITFVGDPNQLMPIGWGSLFSSLIKSRMIRITKLYNCHRASNANNGGNNDGGSNNGSNDNENLNGIIINANKIVECGEEDYNGPAFDFLLTNNFKILLGDVSTIGSLITALNKCKTNPDNIMIISPYNRYLKELNKLCQDIYNPGTKLVKDANGTVWRINDRVMMIENNYTIDVMNGDEGKITNILDQTSEIQVTFKDGKNHLFKINMCNDDTTNDDNTNIEDEKEITTASLIHAYAISVHRSQGSEWDIVILYIPQTSSNSFLNKNLFYTAITRAKKLIWCVGDYDTMLRAATAPSSFRYDNLNTRLQKTREIEM